MPSPDRIKEYSRSVCAQVRWQRAHAAIAEELEGHLLDQRDAHMAEGMDEDAATEKAVAQMGDPALVGAQLDRVHRPKPEWGMIALAAAALLIGCASKVLITRESGLAWQPLATMVALAVGAACAAGAYFRGFSLIGRCPQAVYAVTLAVAAALFLSPRMLNGQAYFVRYAVLAFPLGYAALILSLRGRGYGGVLLCGAGALIPIILAAHVPSAAGLFIFVSAGVALLLTAIDGGWFGVDKLYGRLLVIGPTAGAILAAVIVVAANGGYRWSRLRVGLSPQLDPSGVGYMGAVVRDLLRGARLIGPGAPTQYGSGHWPLGLPGVDSDYLLTYLTHRFGWMAFGVVVLVIGAFIVKGFRLCRRQPSMLGKLISSSVMLTLAGQTVIYLSANLGCQIMSPISLPLISYGNTVTIINLTLIGVMLSVFRTGATVRDGHPSESAPRRLFEWRDGDLVIRLGQHRT